MLKTLFYAIDGLGLGHIIRCINIAKELRKIVDCDVLFATNTHATEIFKKENIPFIKGGADPAQLYKGNISKDVFHETNQRFILTVSNNFMPDIIVFDVVIAPKVIEHYKGSDTFLVYIFREFTDPEYILAHKQHLARFNLILFVGGQDPNSFKKFINEDNYDNKIVCVGNIFKEPDPNKVTAIIAKYKKQENELLITVTAGGGGFFKEARSFFYYICALAIKLNHIFDNKTSQFRRIRWLFIKGPLFLHALRPHGKNIEVYDNEYDLAELFSISDLVVSAGGYNSVNEIIAAKVPAVIFAFSRPIESQMARALSYASSGFIKIASINSLKESISLFENIFTNNKLKAMKQAYDNYEHKNSNRLAATIILERFREYSSSRKKAIAVLRTTIDTAGEFFIYQEADRFLSYKPFYLCAKIKRLDKGKNDFICEPYLEGFYKSCSLLLFPNEVQQKFREIIMDRNAKLLYAQFLTDIISYLPLIKNAGLPLVVNYRGYELSDKRERLFFPKLALASKVIVKSNFQQKTLVDKGIPEEKIQVIYGGIDVDRLPFKLRVIKNDNLKLVSAGRFVEKKGFDITLNLFSEVIKYYPSAKLTLIGEGEKEDEIRITVRKLNLFSSVRILPFMQHNDFTKELYNHNIFVLACKKSSTGDREGVPNVLKEAMASGLPVISTYHAGIPELIEDRKTGFLSKEGDYLDMLEKIKWIIKNKTVTSKICLNARFFIEKEFNINKTAREVENLFDSLIKPDYAKTISELIAHRKAIKFRADLHLISGCNSRCIMCDNWENKIRTSFSKKTTLRLFDDLKKFGVDYIRFHGQEPMLKKDLFSIMAQAKQRKFRIGLKTNALLINPKKARVLCSLIDDIYLSIDSADSDIHNRLRGNSISFDKNINAAGLLKRANPQIQLYINSIITKINYKSLDRMMELGFSLGANKISFVNLNTKNKKQISGLRLRKEQFEELYFDVYPKVLEKSLKFNIPVNIDPYFYSLLGKTKEAQIAELRLNSGILNKEIVNFSRGEYGKEFYKYNVCYGVFDHVTIDWAGNVFPCCAMPRSTLLSTGNVIKDNFYNIWNSEKYTRYREGIIRGKCKFRKECGRSFWQTKEINKYMQKNA